MEQHKQLPSGYERHSPQSEDSMEIVMDKAWAFTTEYYLDTINRIAGTRPETMTPEEFFQEYVWVVHATGFSSHAVTKFMPRLMAAWGPVLQVPNEFDSIAPGVLSVCNNPQKAKAIYQTAMIIQEEVRAGTWQEWLVDISSSIDSLVRLPYIGKVTAYHLARNVGNLDAVKPDLHLVRMATHFGMESASKMVGQMAERLSIKPGIADLALWYYLSTFGSLTYRQEGER